MVFCNHSAKNTFSSQRTLHRVVVFAESDDDRCHHVPFSDSGSEKRLIEKHRASAAVGHPEMVHSAVNMDHLGKYDRTVAVFMYLLKDIDPRSLRSDETDTRIAYAGH